MIIRDVCRKALVISGAVGQEASISASDMQNALDELNDLLNQWSLEEFWQPNLLYRQFTTDTRETIVTEDPLVDPKVEMKAPYEITDLYIKLGDRYSKMKQLNIRDLDVNGEKGQPTSYSYQILEIDKGQILLDRDPDTSYDLKMLSYVQNATYELDDDLMLPPPFVGALTYGLASVLGIVYGTVDSNVQQIAASRFDRIKHFQQFVPDLVSDFRSRGKYNIYTDSWEK